MTPAKPCPPVCAMTTLDGPPPSTSSPSIRNSRRKTENALDFVTVLLATAATPTARQLQKPSPSSSCASVKPPQTSPGLSSATLCPVLPESPFHDRNHPDAR